jgi:hypothetical protein
MEKDILRKASVSINGVHEGRLGCPYTLPFYSSF